MAEFRDDDVVAATVRLSVPMTVVHEGRGWVSECFIEDSYHFVVEVVLEFARREFGDGCESIREDPLTVVDCIWTRNGLEDSLCCVRIRDELTALKSALDVVRNGVKLRVLADRGWAKLLACCKRLVIVRAIWS